MSSGKRKTFILGVGAQKSATTWLYSYIGQSQKSNLGVCKEYHIWDAKYSPICKGKIVKPDEKLNKQKSEIVRFAMQRYDGFYEDYFSSLLAGDKEITADITPSYCLLKQEQLVVVRDRLEKAGFDVRVIFFLRDPVERCWSALRMLIRNEIKAGKEISEQMARERFASFFRTRGQTLRTQYEHIVPNLQAVFPEESLYFGIYESLFTSESLAKLSEFIGIDVFEQHATVRKNDSPIDITLDTDIRTECRDYFRETYEFCNETFP